MTDSGGAIPPELIQRRLRPERQQMMSSRDLVSVTLGRVQSAEDRDRISTDSRRDATECVGKVGLQQLWLP